MTDQVVLTKEEFDNMYSALRALFWQDDPADAEFRVAMLTGITVKRLRQLGGVK